MDVRGHSPVLCRPLVFSDVMGEQVQHPRRAGKFSHRGPIWSCERSVVSDVCD